MNTVRKQSIIAFLRSILRIPLSAYGLPDDKHQRAGELRHDRRELLLWLATYGNADGASIRPSTKSLSQNLGWNERTVYRRLEDLQALHFLKDEGLHEETGCRMRSISPEVCHEFRTGDTGKLPEGVTRVPLPSDTSSLPGDTSSQASTHDLLDPKTDHTAMAISFDGDKSNPVLEVWNYFHEETAQQTFYTLTPTRKRQGEKRFAECLKALNGEPAKAVELMKCAVDALRDSKWHNGKNPEKLNLLNWETLFSSQERFQEWLRRGQENNV